MASINIAPVIAAVSVIAVKNLDDLKEYLKEKLEDIELTDILSAIDEFKGTLPKPGKGAAKAVGKQQKKEKDPLKPKAEPTAYIKFSMEVRPQIKKDFPDLAPKDVMKKIAELWQAKNKTKA